MRMVSKIVNVFILAGHGIAANAMNICPCLHHHSCFPAMKLLRVARACIYALTTLIVFIKVAVSETASKCVSILQKNRFEACRRALMQYLNFFLSWFPLPFVHSDVPQPVAGFPILCPVYGIRKYVTIFVHVIAFGRACCLLPLAFQMEFRASHNGMLTSDLWFVATFYVTAALMVVIWAKTWQSTSLFCWIHNSHLKLNQTFSG